MHAMRRIVNQTVWGRQRICNLSIFRGDGARRTERGVMNCSIIERLVAIVGS
jgi:hypothetical protein